MTSLSMQVREERDSAVPLEHQSSPRYYPGLDGLRGVAILAVIVFHAGLGITPSGAIGVDMFFVLSGYFITSILLIERETSGRISLRNFYSRRALRLLPAFMVFVGVVALFPSHLAINFGMSAWKAYAATLLYLANWVRAFSDNPGVLGIFGITWSLAVEEQFYLLWPPILAIALSLGGSRNRLLFGIAAAVATIALWRIWLVAHGAPVPRINNGFDTRADTILVGCALAFVPLSRSRSSAGLQRLLRYAALASAIFLAAFVTAYVNNDFYCRCGMLLVSLATATIIAAEVAAVRVPLVSRVLEMRWLRWIGRISYSLYLWHLVVFSISLPVPEVLNISLAVGPPGHARVISISTSWTVRLAGAVAAAAFSFYAIERPFLRLKRRFTSFSTLSRGRTEAFAQSRNRLPASI